MQAIPAWMAGYVKVLAVCKAPFWRDVCLSADAMSCHGPLMEIHDASPAMKVILMRYSDLYNSW